MELLGFVLIMGLIPVVSVGPSFVFAGWFFHRLVPRRSQKRVGIIWGILGLFLVPILVVGLGSKSFWTLPIKGSFCGIALAPFLGRYLSEKWPLPERSEPAPIGSQ